MRQLVGKISCKKLILFGTGMVSQLLTEVFDHDVDYYLDNNPNQWGSRFMGKPVEKPGRLQEEDPGEIAVLIASSYVDEISAQLSDMQFVSGVHFWDGYTLLRKLMPMQKFLPGHYYSPIPSITELELERDRIFGQVPDEIPAISLNRNVQLGLLAKFRDIVQSQPFCKQQAEGKRYFYDNSYYPYGDAIILHAMIKILRPRKVIEIGSGFSSAVILDTNEELNRSMDCTFIEPYPERLFSLLKKEDTINLIQQKVQHVDDRLFKNLDAGDMLIVDSSHVSKTGSDLNHIILNLLPILRSGVYVHFHDIFYPFEYPEDWVLDGVAWNEAYLLRAFLQHNDAFEIVFWNHYLFQTCKDVLLSHIPRYAEGPGYSLWIRRR